MREHLIEIWTYIAGDKEAAAYGALAMLADNLRAGRERPELAGGLRSFPVGNDVLFYLVGAGRIDLVRVLSGYRDVGPDDFDGPPHA